MIHKAQRLKRAIEIRFVARQQRKVDVFPGMFEIGGFGGGRQIHKEQSGFGMIAPIAVRKLVSDTQTVKNSSKGVCVPNAEPSFHIDRPHQGIGSFKATPGCPNTVKGGEDRISQSCRLARVEAQFNFQFTKGGEQMANNSSFQRKSQKRGVYRHG